MKTKKLLAIVLCIALIFPAFSLAGCDWFKGIEEAAKMSENFEKAKEKIGTNYKIVYAITDNGESYTGSFIRAGKSGFYGTNEGATLFDNDAKKLYSIDLAAKTYTEAAATEQEIELYITSMETGLFSYYAAAVLLTIAGAKVTDSTVAGRACKKYSFTASGESADYYIDNEYFIMSKIVVKDGSATDTWELTSVKVGGVTKTDFLPGFPTDGYKLEGEEPDPGDPEGLPFTLEQVKANLGTNYSVSFTVETMTMDMKRAGDDFYMNGFSAYIYNSSLEEKYVLNTGATTFTKTEKSLDDHKIDRNADERIVFFDPYYTSNTFTTTGETSTVAGKTCKLYTSNSGNQYYIDTATGLTMKYIKDSLTTTVTAFAKGGQAYPFIPNFNDYTLEGGGTVTDPVQVTEVQDEVDAVMAAGLAAIGTNYSIIYECSSESDGTFVEEFKRVGNLFYYRDGKFADLCLDESFFYDINVVPKTYTTEPFNATNTAKKYADGKQDDIYEEFKDIPLMMSFAKLYKQTGVTMLGRECIKYHVKYNNPSQGNDQIFYIDAQKKILVQWDVIKNNVTATPQKLTSAAYGSMTKENLLPGFPTGYSPE